MAHARETGFYFEPLTERLALVIEGSPFPSDEQWAYVGDPIEMTPEQACLQCALRWQGLDPEAIHVELDLGLNAMLAELAQRSASEDAPAPFEPPAPPDVDALLAQAAELQRAVEGLGPLDGLTPDQLMAKLEELDMARAAAAITASARANRANRELEEERARAPAEPEK